jgi:DNA anti-recombination protein RmuC
MKNKNFILTLLIAGGFLVGCKPSDEKATEQKLDQVQQQTQDAAQQVKNYSYAQKDEFVAKMQAQMTNINQEIQDLTVRIQNSSDKVRAEAQPRLDALRQQTSQLNVQVDKIKNASQSTWEQVKADSQKAFDEMKDKFDQARQWVSDKIGH